MADGTQAAIDGFRKPELIRRTLHQRGRYKGLFRCQCGAEFEAFLANVKRGHTRSCGCLQAESRRARMGRPSSHGHFVNGRPSRTYISWQAMIARCNYKTHPAYHRYGGRGIKVCPRWLDSFESFLEDMGERPIGKTLDRRNSEKGYEKGNCRWATARTQGENRSSSRTLLWKEQPITARRLIEQTGCELSIGAIRSRISRGASVEEALTLPKYEYQRRFIGPRAHKDRAPSQGF